MAVTYIDSGIGWSVDERFYKEAAGDLATLSGRTYRTVSQGPVIYACVYLSASNITGVVVISTERGLAAYEPGAVVSQGSFEYLGYIWYITAFSYWMSGNLADSSGLAQKLSISYPSSAYADIGMAVLRSANAIPSAYLETSNTKIFYNGSSKVIRRLCQIINNVSRLGVSHDTAFYGDLGQEAYEHSQIQSGNPHNVTLEELGIKNIKNQMDLVLDAIGSLDMWACHANEATYFVDHEGDYLVFMVASNLLAWH